MVAARSPNVSPAYKVARSSAGKPARVAAKPRSAPQTWEAKLRPDLEPRIVNDARRGRPLLLPTPRLIGETIAQVPPGRVTTIAQLRAQLAQRFDAESTCPLMTGIFLTVLAGAVAEDLTQRRAPRWPIWRVVRNDGTLHPKWPLDPLYRASMLRAEGARLTRRNGHWTALDLNLS